MVPGQVQLRLRCDQKKSLATVNGRHETQSRIEVVCVLDGHVSSCHHTERRPGSKYDFGPTSDNRSYVRFGFIYTRESVIVRQTRFAYPKLVH